MNLISIVTPCYNEQDNVAEVYRRVREIMGAVTDADYEHIFIDNASTDATVDILRGIAASDPRLRLIINARNFGSLRSPYHAILEAYGDAVILLVADLQDPPELIPEFIARWRAGAKVVVGVKAGSQESPVMFAIRRAYYGMLAKIGEHRLVQNYSGFGLYDRQMVDALRHMRDPSPYLRGLISEVGFEPSKVEYTQASRKRGITSNNFYSLYDIAMLGITSHTKVPLRLATMGGFLLSLISLLIAFLYMLAKLLFWDRFSLGTAPILIGIFFFSSVQLFFIGLLGEYIASIHTRVMNRPLVVERERVNFPAGDVGKINGTDAAGSVPPGA
jgi:glycosyltransferase involved in cell wall biosynthesis